MAEYLNVRNNDNLLIYMRNQENRNEKLTLSECHAHGRKETEFISGKLFRYVVTCRLSLFTPCVLTIILVFEVVNVVK